MQHVIIGAGPAGVVAAEAIRKYDVSSTVTLVGDEPERPYSRMAIPYYLVGQIDEEGTHLRKNPEHYAAMGIDVRRGRVSRIDSAAYAVLLKDGARLEYDRLLITTGFSAMKLPIPGIDLPGVVNCWTLQDARQIAAVCRPGNEVVLVGASSLGQTEHAGVLRGLIQSQTRLNGWKDKLREDPTRVMEPYPASHQTSQPNPS